MRVAGCSVDTFEDQKSFSDKHGFRFPLIADVGGEIAKAYGVWRDDWKVAGRGTAVIGEDGKILKTYPKAPLDGKGHAEHVYAELEALL